MCNVGMWPSVPPRFLLGLGLLFISLLVNCGRIGASAGRIVFVDARERSGSVHKVSCCEIDDKSLPSARHL